MGYPQKRGAVNNHYQYVYLLILVNRRRCAPPFRFVQDTGITRCPNPMTIWKTVWQDPIRIALDNKFFFMPNPWPNAWLLAVRRSQEGEKQGISRGSVDKLMHIHRVGCA
jgi:hypothetical protein